MLKSCRLAASALLVSSFPLLTIGCAANLIPAIASSASGPNVLLNMGPGAGKQVTPTSTQVTAIRSDDPNAPGLAITLQPGPADYPGVDIKPVGTPWNLAAYGHVDARIVNTGAKPIYVTLRLDNAGDYHDNPWNSNAALILPGKEGIVSTKFGYSYGQPGYALKPGAIVNAVLFVGKTDALETFRLESLVAGGSAGEKPPVNPDDIRTKPEEGFLLGAVASAIVPAQISAQNAQARLVVAGNRQMLQITFPAAQGDQSISLRPAQGRWNLSDALEVRVKVKNSGRSSILPRARVESDGGLTDWSAATASLAPGATGQIVVPFTSATPVNVDQKDSGSKLASNVVSAVTIGAENAPSEKDLQVVSIQAAMPSAPTQPVWLGQRPPVGGAWVKTLDDEFSGTKLDTSVWNIYGDNYWDKQSHWAKADIQVGGGVVKLHYEKKTGYSNDDPTKTKTDYAAGYLHTYDKWKQRYGYFEARMKLPTAPGLWPGFWMMPDRGRALGSEQWRRQDTANGGMEFDIMEHLDRWGPNRYDIFMHYDGYGKDHKSVGSDKIYVQPDKDGYITCGLLWTPGSAIYNCNGREVLRWKSPRISSIPSILMFTLPAGGWDNDPINVAKLPDDFVVDYVRVWQRKDLASAMDGKVPAAQAKK